VTDFRSYLGILKYWRKVCTKFGDVDFIHTICVKISLRVHIYMYTHAEAFRGNPYIHVVLYTHVRIYVVRD